MRCKKHNYHSHTGYCPYCSQERIKRQDAEMAAKRKKIDAMLAKLSDRDKKVLLDKVKNGEL